MKIYKHTTVVAEFMFSFDLFFKLFLLTFFFFIIFWYIDKENLCFVLFFAKNPAMKNEND